MTSKILRDSLSLLLEKLHTCIINSKFIYKDNECYIMPVDNSLHNYMVSNDNEFIMIDIDSFEIVQKDRVDDIYNIKYNNKKFSLRRKDE